MNTSAKGASYESSYRRWYEKERKNPRLNVFWWPPRPRQHSTGRWDSMRWEIGFDDVGDVLWRTEPTLIEFKGHFKKPMSCQEAKTFLDRANAIRPSFTRAVVIHYRKDVEFCEH